MLMIPQDRNRTISLASRSCKQGRHGQTVPCLVPAALFLFLVGFAGSAQAQHIVVDATPSHVTNTIRPTEALGAGIDRIPYGAADKLFVDSTVGQVLAAGWQTVTYRQNTELHMEA